MNMYQYGGQSGEEERHTRRPKKAVKGNDVGEDLPSASSSTIPAISLLFHSLCFIFYISLVTKFSSISPNPGTVASNPISTHILFSLLDLIYGFFQFGSNVGLSCSSYNHCKVQILIILLV